MKSDQEPTAENALPGAQVGPEVALILNPDGTTKTISMTEALLTNLHMIAAGWRCGASEHEKFAERMEDERGRAVERVCASLLNRCATTLEDALKNHGF